ncbi:hypothetical protein [Hyphomicrobium sp.]|uniref:hypothetical protein n=1 Tax=Hyphomicrobium sp. TaxID=82 RepID=UPI0025BDB398|nr:hypothetical protein [Hyphomicrobium sp.]MCC7251618.1 hypothetical protein [Hyphomicrobium sp.]
MAAAPGQESIIRDGVPALVSRKKHVVMLKPNSRVIDGSARPAFTIVVNNMSGAPHDLLESSISARQNVEGKHVAVRVHRYDELVQEEKDKQAVQAFAAVLSGTARAMSAANAGYVTSTGGVNTYGYGGRAYGTYTATTYDPLRAQIAQQAANAETANDFDRLRIEGERNLSGLQQTILKDNTVLPGEWYGGTVVLDRLTHPTKGPTEYIVQVEFAGEMHEFAVKQVAS